MKVQVGLIEYLNNCDKVKVWEIDNYATEQGTILCKLYTTYSREEIQNKNIEFELIGKVALIMDNS